MQNANAVIAPETERRMALIAEAVSKGECILFLGSAVHCAPPANSGYTYNENERPPMAWSLSERLAAQTDFATILPNDEIGNLQRVAQYYESLRQRSGLVREIKDAVSVGKKPSPALHLLAQLDFPLVITTNYDRLFEDALRAAGKEPYVSVYKKNEDRNEVTQDYPYDEKPTAQSPFIFKIHGDIESPESIVITDEDYIQFVLRMSDKQECHPVPETLRFFFKRWPTLFIGYSLKDYNLRLLFKTLRWKVDKADFPAAYSVDRSPDPLIFDVFSLQRRYITFLTQDLWTFIPDLHKRIRPNAATSAAAQGQGEV